MRRLGSWSGVVLSLALVLCSVAQAADRIAVDPAALAVTRGAPLFADAFTSCGVLLWIGEGIGAPGSTGNPVRVSLNSSGPIERVELGVADSPEQLTAGGCMSLVAGFACSITDNGAVSIVFESSASETVPESEYEPLLDLLYDVAPAAPAGTVSLIPRGIVVVGAGGERCSVSGVSGRFEVPVCGNGAVEPGEGCDDGNQAGGDCCSAACEPEGLSAPCDDARSCTTDDKCDGSGNCTGSTIDCSDGDLCTLDSCDEGTTECVHVLAPQTPGCVICGNGIVDGTDQCDDGNAVPGDCCSPSCTFEAAGTPCNDGLFCTAPDSCDGVGHCGASSAPCDDGIACTLDGCNENNDSCTHMAQHAACDDGLFCTGAEFCSAASGCMQSPPPCSTSGCDEGTDACLGGCGDGVVQGAEQCDDGNAEVGDCCSPACTFEAAGTPCNDGAPCTTADACNGAGTCGGVPPVGCDDGIACTVDTCNGTSSCNHLPSDQSCSDGVFCNGVESCSVPSGCQPGTPPCAPGLCNESSDSCSVCGNGVRENGEVCDDGNTSSADCCLPTCVGTTAGTPCIDGLFCTTADACDGAGICASGPPTDCSDAVACTTDACNEVTNQCTHTSDHTSCIDGLFCNGSETCSPAGCQPGFPPCGSLECNETTDTCPFTVVPTVSEWGLILLCVLLVLAGTKIFGRVRFRWGAPPDSGGTVA